MQTFKIKITKTAAWILFGLWLGNLNVAWAETNLKAPDSALKAREHLQHQGMDHSKHNMQADQTGGFRGVFYGYLPCKEKGCDGIKQTLSLKPKNNYLLVTQYAKDSTREYYEKGKYEWNDKNRRLVLTPKKGGAVRLYAIQDESALLMLKSDGSLFPGSQDDYTLSRSDKANTREVHIH